MHSINIQPSFSIQYIDNIQIDPFSTFQYHQKLCVMKDLAALWIMSIVCIHHCLITRGLASSLNTSWGWTMRKTLTVTQTIWSKWTFLHKPLKESFLECLRKTQLGEVTEGATQGRLVTVFLVRDQGMKNNLSA